MTMKKLFIGGLALALLVSASENAAAQEEKKMTRDEYVAQMADLTGREGTAKGQIGTHDAEIEALKAQLAQLDRDNADLNAQILTTFFERCHKDTLLRDVCEVASLPGRPPPSSARDRQAVGG